MRTKAALIPLILLVLFFTGACTNNLFMEWDRPEVPSSGELDEKAADDPDGFLSDVEDYLDGDAVDEENADDIIGAIKDNIYDPGSGTPPDQDDETEQKAALLIGEVAIAGNENAGKVVDNLAGVLTQVADGSSSNPEDFIRALLPPDLSPSEFSDMIDALVQAGEAYLAFGESIGSGATEEDVPFMSSADIGDTLNRAAAGIAVIAALDVLDGGSMSAEPVGGFAQADKDALYDLVYNGTGSFIEDPTMVFDGTVTAYEGAANLLDLSGFEV